eukprot:scaffold3827_cov179-Cylindrotheca_fusiformis.AAC.27
MSHATDFESDFFQPSQGVLDDTSEEEAKKRCVDNEKESSNHKKARLSDSDGMVSSDPLAGCNNGSSETPNEYYTNAPTSDLLAGSLDNSIEDSTTTHMVESTKRHDADPNNSSNNSNNNDGIDPQEHPELDAITREAGLILDDKLQGVREWCKKLLQEITVYVQVTAKTQEEYSRIQRLEHQESDRLDRVEPDVKGATSHLLLEPSFFGSGAPSANAPAGGGVSNQT